MSSKCFVIDEWLFHDLLGENGETAQAESFNFLKTLVEKCDKIASLKGSRWMEKICDLMRNPNPIIIRISKYFILNIIRNSLKFIMLTNCEVIPEDLIKLIPNDDLYLFQIYFSIPADAMITTDRRLYGLINNEEYSITLLMRDQFMEQYIM